MEMERVSACTYPLRDRPWQEAVDVIEAAGFSQIDLLGRMPHLSLDPEEWDPAEVKAYLDARGLRIANLGTYVGRGFSTPDTVTRERELEQLYRAVDLAAFFGARSIRVALGDDRAELLDTLVPWFQRGAAYAARQGIYLGFETHGGGISGDIARCVEIVEKVGSPYFGVLYDPCNVFHHGGDYREALQRYGRYIVHVHLKDGRFQGERFIHTMLGKGQVDLSWVIAQLKTLSYAGTFALEYELSNPPPEQGLADWRLVAETL